MFQLQVDEALRREPVSLQSCASGIGPGKCPSSDSPIAGDKPPLRSNFPPAGFLAKYGRPTADSLNS